MPAIQNTSQNPFQDLPNSTNPTFGNNAAGTGLLAQWGFRFFRPDISWKFFTFRAFYKRSRKRRSNQAGIDSEDSDFSDEDDDRTDTNATDSEKKNLNKTVVDVQRNLPEATTEAEELSRMGNNTHETRPEPSSAASTTTTHFYTQSAKVGIFVGVAVVVGALWFF